MKAMRIGEYGGSSNILLDDVARPEPKADEVLVKVHAAGVNPIDWKIRAGYLKDFLPHSLPLTLGWDVSGTIESVGADVTDFSVGDAVYGQLDASRDGAYAEYVVSAPRHLSPKPDRLSFVEAAGVPIAAMAAWQALFGDGGADLKKGQMVLIHAAAGGVGSFAVQFAKSVGATIFGTASAGNLAFLTALGVDRVIDYNSQRFEDAVQDVDVVVDNIGGETQARSWDVLRKGGAMVSMNGDQWSGTPRDDVRKCVAFGAMAAPHMPKITRLIDEGKVQPVIAEIMRLEDAAQAHIKSESGHVRGKIVLQIN